MSIKFSIVTVSYNSDVTIKDTLESVKNQSYVNYEHIIVDGASVDNTLNIVRNYASSSDKVKVLSEPDNGIYDAMNKGINLAKGDLIVFLNSDDTFELNALEIINDNFTSDVDIIYGDTYCLDKYNGATFEKKRTGNIEELQKSKGMIPHNSMFVKSSIMKENLFDENFKICADYKFVLNMYKEKKIIKYIPYKITNMMNDGISNKQLDLWLTEHIRCQNEILGYITFNIEKRKKQIKKQLFLTNVLVKIVPSNFYIKYRYLNNGWMKI